MIRAAGTLLLIFRLGLPPAASAANTAAFEFAEPVRIALASCTDFPWVSDLEPCEGTVELLRTVAAKKLGVPESRIDSWQNGSADAFKAWLGQVGAKGEGKGLLILYFVSHQLSDGETKFSDGPDLPAEEMIAAVNRAAAAYRRVLFVNDSCFGPVLEEAGRFSANVIRLYSSRPDEEACSVRFGKGPYGLSRYMGSDLHLLERELGWRPEGMTLLGVVGLKEGLAFARSGRDVLRLQDWFSSLSAGRNAYDDQVRQRNVPRFVLLPGDANLELIRRRNS